MVAALLGKSAKDDAETRLLGESAIIDGPNVRDLPSPPEPRVSVTPSMVEKSPQPAPPKQADRKKSSLPKPISPKSVSQKEVESDAMSEGEVKIVQGQAPIEPEVMSCHLVIAQR